MSHAPRPDPTNAVRDALADPTEHAAAEAAPTSQVQVLTSQANAVRRLEDAAARRAFTGVLEANAEAVANVLVQKALEGDVGAAMAVASRLAPPARPERRVHVPDLPPLTTPENCREAERRVGEAAAAGEVSLDDAISLARLIASVAEGQANAEGGSADEDDRAARERRWLTHAAAGTGRGGRGQRVSQVRRTCDDDHNGP